MSHHNPKLTATAPCLDAEDAVPVLHALCNGGALAMITAIDGRFYRPLGAIMGVAPDGKVTGSLSAGCVDGDVARHAALALTDGAPRHLRYGKGSPFFDITLPCGSGLEISVVPAPDRAALQSCLTQLDARQNASLTLAGLPPLTIRAALRLVILGQGPEAEGLIRVAKAAGIAAQSVTKIDPTEMDDRTAIVVLTHDHEGEIAPLVHALRSNAFWVGAQGSTATHRRRLAHLAREGVNAQDLARLRGPIGVIPRAKRPEVLAISVLAEITAAAQ